MDAAEIKAMYADMCLMTVVIRRYSGPPAARTSVDYTVKGHFRQVTAKEIIGTVAQGDMAVIVLADDLTAAGLPLPIVTADRAVLAGKERQIMTIGERKALDGALVAYELQARG